jgi:hypothetical protein
MPAPVGIPPAGSVRARWDGREHTPVASVKVAVRRERSPHDLANRPAPNRPHRITPTPATRARLNRDYTAATPAELPIIGERIRADPARICVRALKGEQLYWRVNVAIPLLPPRRALVMPGRNAEQRELPGGRLSPTTHRLCPKAAAELVPTAHPRRRAPSSRGAGPTSPAKWTAPTNPKTSPSSASGAALSRCLRKTSGAALLRCLRRALRVGLFLTAQDIRESTSMRSGHPRA